MVTVEASSDAAAAYLCETKLHQYIKVMWKHAISTPFVDNWHIGAIAEHLQAVSDGQIKKLLINIPPGMTKSASVGIFWPTWQWGPHNMPETRSMYFSYDLGRATNDATIARELINSEFYQRYWGDRFSWAGDQNVKKLYRNSKKGWRMSSSIGSGGALGEHPHQIVVDDPNSIESTPEERLAVREWWDVKMSMRGIGIGVSYVGVMQRIAEDDWSGHVLAEGDWVHLCLPQYYEGPSRMTMTPLGWTDPRTVEGSYEDGVPEGVDEKEVLLNPGMFSDAKLREPGRKLGEYGRASQWQQRPASKRGNMFDVTCLQMIKPNQVPARFSRVCRFWDKAATDSLSQNANDRAFTAGPLCGWLNGKFYILGMQRKQLTPAGVENLIRFTGGVDEGKYGLAYTAAFEHEGGSAGPLAAYITTTRLRGLRVRAVKPYGEKPERAEPLSIAMENGEVYMVSDVDLSDDDKWNEACINELKAFPFGSRKDQVDGLSGAYLYLSRPRASAFLKFCSDDDPPREYIRRMAMSGSVLVPEGASIDGRQLTIGQEQLRRIAVYVSAEDRSTHLKADGQSSHAGGERHTIHIWDLFTPRKMLFLRHVMSTDEPWDVFAPNGKQFIDRHGCKSVVCSDHGAGPEFAKKWQTKKMVTRPKIEEQSTLVQLQDALQQGRVFIPFLEEAAWADEVLFELADWCGDPEDPYGHVIATLLAVQAAGDGALVGSWGGASLDGGAPDRLRW